MFSCDGRLPDFFGEKSAAKRMAPPWAERRHAKSFEALLDQAVSRQAQSRQAIS